MRNISDADLSAFARLGWLSQVPVEFRELFLSRCDRLSVETGEAIYNVGDEAGGLYGVVEGQVGIHGTPHGASAALLHLVGPGFWTGECAAATQQTRIIALVARTPARVLRLSRAALLRIAEQDPQTWRYILLMVVQNTARSIAVINALRRESAAERLAATLVNLGAEFDENPSVIRASQDDLGALARLSRGSVNAALTRLERAGLIRRDYGAITLRDPAALASYVDPT